MSARPLKRPAVALLDSRLPSDLTLAQQNVARQFADELRLAIRGNPDVGGLMLAEVAANLSHAGQFFTSRLLQNAADVYEGKR